MAKFDMGRFLKHFNPKKPNLKPLVRRLPIGVSQDNLDKLEELLKGTDPKKYPDLQIYFATRFDGKIIIILIGPSHGDNPTILDRYYRKHLGEEIRPGCRGIRHRPFTLGGAGLGV